MFDTSAQVLCNTLSSYLKQTLIDCIVFHNKLTRSGSFRELVLTGFISYLRWKNQIATTERWKCNNTMHMNGNQSQVQQLIQKILKAALIATSVLTLRTSQWSLSVAICTAGLASTNGFTSRAPLLRLMSVLNALFARLRYLTPAWFPFMAVAKQLQKLNSKERHPAEE